MKTYPYGARVWVGYRHAQFKQRRSRFIESLGSIFIPATVQQMKHLNLCAYFPLILADTNFRLPDEIALVVYPSPAIYESVTRGTTAGRAYGALHGNYFNFDNADGLPASYSGFPGPWQGELEIGKPVALIDHSVDWLLGATTVLLGARPEGVDPALFLDSAKQLAIQLAQSPPENTDNILLVVDEDFLIVWEHTQTQRGATAAVDLFESIVDRDAVRSRARVCRVKPVFSLNDPGIDPFEGELFDIREETV
ncbi:hypothetical protein [Agaribacterium haliotis]|uniref:hypothetical protein n=1 Tax=Agaribacterium haliotis TaxID=2013869 RepID=UPI000BB56C84|nr:hypothetical protein [Agaribacterium haliotis]